MKKAQWVPALPSTTPKQFRPAAAAAVLAFNYECTKGYYARNTYGS